MEIDLERENPKPILSEPKMDFVSLGELKTYERKSLFIFPPVFSRSVSSGLIDQQRKSFLDQLMYRMFVKDFRRINFFDVAAKDSVESFIENSHAYIRKNVKQITARRLQPDGKFKEAMVTGEDLIKTTSNSFVLVPFIDSIERKVIRGEESTSYDYDMYVHFDIYNTKNKTKIATLKINNKKNLFGMLAKNDGDIMINLEYFASLSEESRKDEKSFRKTAGKLFTVLKKKMKELEEFRIMATLSQISRSKFGFDMGRDHSIKIDHRYKTYVNKSDGSRKMTGFGKIRKVEETYSEAQTLIGKPQEGDQLVEDPKLGINFIGGFATAPLAINQGTSEHTVSGSHPCIFLGLEYEMGPLTGISELYSAVNLRLASPGVEGISYYDSATQILLNLGLIKKLYFKRFALNLGGYIGIHSASLNHGDDDLSGSSFGVTLNSSLEIMFTPAISLYGGLNLDFYPNPGKLHDGSDDEEGFDLPPGWKWNAKGLSLNLGAKVTF